MVLLVVDTQKLITNEKLYKFDMFVSNVNNKFMVAEQSYEYYNEFMWNGRYAECISLDETIKRMK